MKDEDDPAEPSAVKKSEPVGKDAKKIKKKIKKHKADLNLDKEGKGDKDNDDKDNDKGGVSFG